MGAELAIYYANGIACALTGTLLFWFERRSQLRLFTACCVYMLIVATGSVFIRTLYGTYPAPDVSEMLINVAMAIITIRARGQVVWYLKHPEQKP